MFKGEYQHSLDDKGRLTIPAKFREGLGDDFVITRGLDRCLFVYPRAEWEALEGRIKTLPMNQPEVRGFVRLLYAGAIDGEPDKQGRVNLPQTLRDYAGIEKDVVITAALNRVEIWSAKNWAEYSGKLEPAFSEIAEKIEGLGI